MTTVDSLVNFRELIEEPEERNKVKKFNYSLQSVLSYRESEQEQCRQKLADAERLVRQQEDELERVRGEIRKARHQQPIGPSAQYLILRERYLGRLRTDEKGQETRLTELQEYAETSRNELITASREVMKMEKVKDREYRHWEVESRREEQHLMDEVGTSRSTRHINMI
ncbi:flagellar export protein FliJ [bacterium M21]|nr:flagellar export protein FliJ [bacterium M21]